MHTFEKLVRELTVEINGQYPRPWMTELIDPSVANVLVVGLNPASAYSIRSVDYERYINSLFNRDGETCKDFYLEVTRQSPTRGNIEKFSEKLKLAGVTNILETNVNCYSTKKSKDLSLPEHAGGREQGRRIFHSLVDQIKPRVIVVHGSGVAKELAKTFGLRKPWPSPPKSQDKIEQFDLTSSTTVFVIPSLALPGYNNWCRWAEGYMEKVAKHVAMILAC